MTNRTKEQRRAARQFALANIADVRQIATRVDINDVHGSHITVWLGRRRIEWWPGAGVWASRGPQTKADRKGEFAAFCRWLSRQDAQPEDDFEVIEE